MKQKLFVKKTERVAATKHVTAPKKVRPFSFFNLLLTIVLWVALVVFFYGDRLRPPLRLIPGQRAPETIAASVDFKSVNQAATDSKFRQVADEVLPVFYIDNSATENAQWVLTTNQLSGLLPSGSGIDLQRIVLSAISNASARGIISAGDFQTRFNGKAPSGKVALRGNHTDSVRTLNSFFLPVDALNQATTDILSALPIESRKEDKKIRALITPCLWPNLQYDAVETDVRREQEIALVEPVIETVMAGTILVRNGDVISEQILTRLTAHEKRLIEMETPAERIRRLAGSGVMLLLGLVMTALVASFIQPSLLHSRRQLVLLITLSVFPLMIGKGVLYSSVNWQWLPAALLDFAMPLAIAPMMASILLGRNAGLIAGLGVSFILATLLGGSFIVFSLGLLVACASVYTTRDVKRRMALFRAGFWVGAVEILVALVLAVLEPTPWTVLLSQMGLAMFWGLVTSLLAMLFIPIFEHLFKVTTDISLLELSDLSHPLLQGLAINAPGTYHHSLTMASLAQNAAEAIGANGLMLRVCAYFHDIGKLVKPGFFSENIHFSENPHDELTPSMSKLIIVAHIKEGVALARKHKLPQVIIDGIEQHQGTSLVTVFYHRAKSQMRHSKTGPTTINDEDFRYDGPKPQTREMAILMLADGCEAASRSLEKPTPVRIANLIQDIFDSRLRDGQLSECALTLAELNKIKQSFVFSLTNMLHGRIAYPKLDEESTESK